MENKMFNLTRDDFKKCTFRSEPFAERKVITFKEITKPIIEYCKINKIIE